MSQRDSGYARQERDLYETPAWVTEALIPHIFMRPRNPCKPNAVRVPMVGSIWEPACGSGKMASVLKAAGYPVFQTDIGTGVDFLTAHPLPMGDNAIITNPPYELATEFCERALSIMEPRAGVVAMLLRTDFDHAKSRTHLFRDCPAFAKKVVLMRRIAWFVEANGKPKASPSFNHAWYIWDLKHEGAPTIAYGP